MSATTACDRPPDAVITASCAIDEGSFADVDSDGIDDLVLRSGPTMFSWPSSRRQGAPLVWRWEGTGDPGWVDVSTPNVGPARVQRWSFTPDGTYEYEVEPDTLALVLVGSGQSWGGVKHIGDVDGDGAADLYGRDSYGHPYAVRASNTGLYTGIPGWGYSSYEPWPYEYSPYNAWSVGDMNHDGFDDLLVAQRQGEPVVVATGYYDSRRWGPAQLYLGSPTGIQTEPLWTLFAPDDLVAGVGRGAAALPDEGVVVVTVVAEGLFYGDHSPEFLGVIRDSGTPDAYFDQLVQVPEITPGGFTPYLEGWMDDGTGQQALAMGEFSGSTGVRWFPWFADGSGFHPDDDGVAVPSASWAPPSDQALDGELSALSFSVGRHNQAILLGLHTETGYQLLEWGRPPGELGIPVQGVTAEGCTFAVAGLVPPDSAAAPKAEPEGCGCDSSGGPGWLAGLVVLLGRVAQRRGHRRRFATIAS